MRQHIRNTINSNKLDRNTFLLRLKEGDTVLLRDGDSTIESIVELKDVYGDRIWLSNGKSVSCRTGLGKSYSIEY